MAGGFGDLSEVADAIMAAAPSRWDAAMDMAVFQKTGLHRQAQLAALLARVARTFGPPSGLRCPE
jgi:hypothetical protein